MTSSTRTLLKQVQVSEWGGPDRHPHLLLTLEHMRQQGHWRGQGTNSLQVGAVTTGLQSQTQSEGLLAQLPKEKNTPNLFSLNLASPNFWSLWTLDFKAKNQKESCKHLAEDETALAGDQAVSLRADTCLTGIVF